MFCIEFSSRFAFNQYRYCSRSFDFYVIFFKAEIVVLTFWVFVIKSRWVFALDENSHHTCIFRRAKVSHAKSASSTLDHCPLYDFTTWPLAFVGPIIFCFCSTQYSNNTTPTYLSGTTIRCDVCHMTLSASTLVQWGVSSINIIFTDHLV